MALRSKNGQSIAVVVSVAVETNDTFCVAVVVVVVALVIGIVWLLVWIRVSV